MDSVSNGKPPLPPNKKKVTSPRLGKKPIGMQNEVSSGFNITNLLEDIVTDSGGNMEQFDSGFLSGENISSKSDIKSLNICASLSSTDVKSFEFHSGNPSDAVPTISKHISKLSLETQNPKIYSRSDSGIEIQDTSTLNSPSESELSPSKQITLNSINEMNETGSPVGCNANGSSPVSQKLLQTVFLPNEDGDTHLHLAIIHGHTEIVYGLIRIIPDPRVLNLMNDLGQTALHLAVATSQFKMARRLALAGARLDSRDNFGNTPFHLACELGDIQCVQALTKPVTKIERLNGLKNKYCELGSPSQLPLELRNYDGMSCIHIATVQGHLQILQYLLCLGADINAKEGKGGRTPLHFAVYLQNVPLIRFLCDFGADIDAETYGCCTPLQIAALNSPSLVSLLQQLGATSQPLSDSDSDSDSYSEWQDKPLVLQNHFNDIRINGEPLDIY